jgi:hypothetical protein
MKLKLSHLGCSAMQSGLHYSVSQKLTTFVTTAVRTQNPTGGTGSVLRSLGILLRYQSRTYQKGGERKLFDNVILEECI